MFRARSNWLALRADRLRAYQWASLASIRSVCSTLKMRAPQMQGINSRSRAYPSRPRQQQRRLAGWLAEKRPVPRPMRRINCPAGWLLFVAPTRAQERLPSVRNLTDRARMMTAASTHLACDFESCGILCNWRVAFSPWPAPTRAAPNFFR